MWMISFGQMDASHTSITGETLGGGRGPPPRATQFDGTGSSRRSAAGRTTAVELCCLAPSRVRHVADLQGRSLQICTKSVRRVCLHGINPSETGFGTCHVTFFCHHCGQENVTWRIPCPER